MLRTGARVVLLALSVFPWLAPYELIVKPDWQGYWNVPCLLAAIVSVGALAVSFLLVWAAVAGLNSVLRIDKTEGTLTYSSGGPVVRWRSARRSMDEIADLEIGEREWSDGGPSYFLVVRMVGGETFKSGSSWSRKEIEDIHGRVSSFLGLSVQA